MSKIWWWVGFNVAVLTLLSLDLGVFHRRARAVSLREAAAWCLFWVVLSLSFAGAVYFSLGRQPGLEFLTGYMVEYALSVDNIFVFVLIFSYFSVPREYQHRVLFWGILGALFFRGVMIGLGAALITRFDWVLYLFGAFLVFTGVKMARHRRDVVYDPSANPALRLLRRILPITPEYHGQRFFARVDWKGRMRLVATPLFVTLVLVETTDVVFATDSIPAIFAVTRDPFLVYTATVCAVLGLRAMYFLLAGVVDRLHYLQLGLSAVLVFIGGKMLLEEVYHVPVPVSLAVVTTLLGTAAAASLLWPRRQLPALPAFAALIGTRPRAPEKESAESPPHNP